MNRLRAWLDALGGRQVLANAGWLYAEQAVRAVLALTAFAAMARHLGPENFGVLSFAVAFAGMFIPLAALGLDYVVVMELVRNPDRSVPVLATAMWVKCLGLMVALLAVGLGWLLVDGANPARPLLLVTSLSLLIQPGLVFDAWFQSRMASRYAVLARLTANVLGSGARIILVMIDAPVVWFAWVFSIEALLYAAGLLIAVRQAEGFALAGWWRKFDAKLARRLVGLAWPLFLADIAIMGYLRMDQMLLAGLGGADQLGRYAAAFRLADALEYFLLALINSQFPVLVAIHTRDQREFLTALGKFMRRMAWLAVLVAVALSFGATGIIRAMLGVEFRGTGITLATLAWANVCVTLVAVRGKWLLLEGLQVYSLVFFASGAVLHLGGVWFAAGRWGAGGAAFSFLLAQAAMALVVPSLFRATRPAAILALRSLLPLRG